MGFSRETVWRWKRAAILSCGAVLAGALGKIFVLEYVGAVGVMAMCLDMAVRWIPPRPEKPQPPADDG